jgi:hypothetical protein
MNLTPSNRYDFAILDSLDELWVEDPHRFNLAGRCTELGRRILRKMAPILTWDDLHECYPSSNTDWIWINRIRTRLGIFKGGKVESPGKKQGWRISSWGRDWIRDRRDRFAAEQYSALSRLAKSVNELLRRGRPMDFTTMSIDEIIRKCGWDLEPNAFRNYDVWCAFQQGAPNFRPFRDGGLVLSFSPEGIGQHVERITMRVDRLGESAGLEKRQ